MRGKPVSFSVTIFQSHFVEDLIVQLTKRTFDLNFFLFLFFNIIWFEFLSFIWSRDCCTKKVNLLVYIDEVFPCYRIIHKPNFNKILKVLRIMSCYTNCVLLYHAWKHQILWRAETMLLEYSWHKMVIFVPILLVFSIQNKPNNFGVRGPNLNLSRVKCGLRALYSACLS